jgi:hypothetical protein
VVFTAEHGPFAGRDLAVAGIQVCGGSRYAATIFGGLIVWDVTNRGEPGRRRAFDRSDGIRLRLSSLRRPALAVAPAGQAFGITLLFSFTVTVLTTLVPALTVTLSLRLLSFRRRMVSMASAKTVSVPSPQETMSEDVLTTSM